MSFIVRPAQISDKEKLENLFLEFVEFNLKNLKGLSRELLATDSLKQFAETTINRYYQEGHIMFVAETNSGEVIGYVSGSVHYDPHLLHYPEAEIIDWFVTAEHRHVGVGKELLETFFAKAKELGCKSMSLESFVDNKEAISLYQRLGFTPDSVILKKTI